VVKSPVWRALSQNECLNRYADCWTLMVTGSFDMNEKLPISVVMIARNEARRLPRSLGGVQDWVSEIIVVTNDCTDDTAAVAESFGAHVQEHKFVNLRDQKAFAISLAQQPWILGLDADEEISHELKREISEFISCRAEGVNGVWFSRRLWFLDRWIRHGDVYPDRVLRLFRRGYGHVAGVEEHDKMEVEGKVIYFKNDLFHYSFESIAAQVGKINFFTRYFVARAKSKSKKFSVLEALLRSWWRFNRAYFLRLGFLDGYPGFYLANFTAFSTFIRYSSLFEQELNSKNKFDANDGMDVKK
jgi:glycosyltransferase involved in cell wall biosynthesis